MHNPGQRDGERRGRESAGERDEGRAHAKKKGKRSEIEVLRAKNARTGERKHEREYYHLRND